MRAMMKMPRESPDGNESYGDLSGYIRRRL
jgi:hypothetical protein